MRKRIAVIFYGDIFDRKGATNATINRIKYLKSYPQYEIVAYCIVPYEYWLIRRLRHTIKREKVKIIEVEGVSVNLIWYTYSLLDHILSVKLHHRAPFWTLFAKTIVSRFRDYDLISAHSNYAGEVASLIHEKYNIPFCITWHGSDIHTIPFLSKYNFVKTKILMERANWNFFVSKALMLCSEKITTKIHKGILYNGASENFYKYSDTKRESLRMQYGVNNSKVIAFVGNLFYIKNAHLLPDIFEQIQNKSDLDIAFWIIGDGKLRPLIEAGVQNKSVKCVFWGNQSASVMPDLMNCIDILILPSKNEGLPLVTIEALQCGAIVIGSDVGGIKEVIGDNYVVKIEENFIENFSNKVLEVLSNDIKTQVLPRILNWKKTAELESIYYQKILNN